MSATPLKLTIAEWKALRTLQAASASYRPFPQDYHPHVPQLLAKGALVRVGSTVRITAVGEEALERGFSDLLSRDRPEPKSRRR
jgi:hypothetical protein